MKLTPPKVELSELSVQDLIVFPVRMSIKAIWLSAPPVMNQFPSGLYFTTVTRSRWCL